VGEYTISKSSERISKKASPASKNDETQPAQHVREIMLTFKEATAIDIWKFPEDLDYA
jgi:hypothetical protein